MNCHTPPSETRSQDIVRATVHLAGPVEIETGHRAHYSAEHIQARIGSALLYFLDALAAVDFAAAARAASDRAGSVLLEQQRGTRLPGRLRNTGQEASVIVRMRGRQQLGIPRAHSAAESRDGRPFVTAPVGGLVLVLHTHEALSRLVRVATGVERLAAALWPLSDELTATEDVDEFARAWEQRNGSPAATGTPRT